jgi:hypothetical protein
MHDGKAKFLVGTLTGTPRACGHGRRRSPRTGRDAPAVDTRQTVAGHRPYRSGY